MDNFDEVFNLQSDLPAIGKEFTMIKATDWGMQIQVTGLPQPCVITKRVFTQFKAACAGKAIFPAGFEVSTKHYVKEISAADADANAQMA